MAVKITYFVHGTTTDNKDKLSTGWIPGELTEKGIEQSIALKNQTNIDDFDLVISSDLKRAVDSANYTFEGFKEIKHDSRIRECNYGDLNGKPSDLVRYEDHIEVPFPNGESLKDVETRVRNLCNYLLENYNGKHIAIVAHRAPQLAFQVITEGKTWEQAINEDWRINKAWQPGWIYIINDINHTGHINEFEGKIALVTGGTSGIGKKIVEELLKKGTTVIINYGHNTEQAQNTINDLIEYKDKMYLIKADISNNKEVKSMFKEILIKYGKLDYLVNSAGTNIDSFIEEFDIEDWAQVLNVNLTGKFLCTKYAIPLLRKSNNASIVNIASRLGTKPCAEASAYCVAESGIITLTKCSALELSNYGIRVNTVSPGLTITPLSLNGWTEKEIEQIRENNPSKRLGETIDIANAVLFLLSDNASYINGENINVNGGSLL